MWREIPPDETITLDVDGHRIVAYSFGKGDDVLFLVNGGPGLPCDYLREAHSCFIDQGFRVVAFDQLDCGASDRPFNYGLQRFARSFYNCRVRFINQLSLNSGDLCIRSTALLELKIVEGGPAATEQELLASYGGTAPPDMEVVTGLNEGLPGDRPTQAFYLVRQAPAITGRDLRNARPQIDQNGAPAIGFSLNSEGAAKFGRVTSENVGRQLAIILDNRVESAPRIDSRIDGEGQLHGSFTTQEAADLALVLRSGALPASLTYLEQREVGPSLGRDSIVAGISASLAGLVFVSLFMLVYYRMAGINAIVSVVMNLVILLGFMAYLGAAMTLPGIAGFILTIGMGVDSNVLIFERIREELATGKSARQAVAASFDRVFVTILDTHIASLIAAAFLFQFGTGPIRGFATTLFFGLVANVFTAVFVSRTMFELILSRKPAGAVKLSV